jgi:hypothetical protein
VADGSREGPELPRDHPIRVQARAERAQRERAAWAFEAIERLTPGEQLGLADWLFALLCEGEPPPAFFTTDLAAQADLWAAWASPMELRCYFRACWRHLAPADRAVFVRWIAGRRAA